MFLLWRFLFIVATISVSPALHSITIDDEHDAKKPVVFERVIQHVQTHLDFLRDCKEYFENHNTNTSPLDMSSAVAIAHNNINNLTKLEERLIALKDGSVDLEETIRFILLSRLSTLQKRKNNIIKRRSDPNIRYGLTAPQLFRDYPVDVQIQVGLTVDTYQTFNKIILDLLSLMDLKNLTVHTEKAIRMSPTLFPLIQGANDDLGHPDQAILEDNGSFREADVYFYENHEFPSCVMELTTYATCYRSPNKTLFLLTPYEYEEYTYDGRRRTIQSLPDPYFLKREVSLDTHQLQNTSKAVIDVDMPGIMESTTSADWIEETVESQMQSDELPAKELLGIDVTNSPIPMDDGTILDDQLPLLLATAVHVPSSFSKATLTTAAPKIKSAEKQVEIKEAAHDPYAYIRGKHRRTLEAIMDTEHFHPISYDRFASLWESVGGTISGFKSGGSHRTLIWDNKVIAGIYKPHGGHDYGKRIIGKLRDALIEVLPTFKMTS